MQPYTIMFLPLYYTVESVILSDIGLTFLFHIYHFLSDPILLILVSSDPITLPVLNDSVLVIQCII